MKKWKHIASMLLVAAMVLSMAACGGGSESAPPAADASEASQAESAAEASSAASEEAAEASETEVDLDQTSSDKENEVVFWNLWSGADGEKLNEIVAEFNETNPDGIKVISLTQDWDQYYTKLRTSILGGQSPDLAVSHGTRALEMIESGVVDPLDPAFEKAGIDIDWSQISPGTLEWSTVDGVHYSLPVDNLMTVMMYNKDVLADCDLLNEDGTPNFTDGWDNFIAAMDTMEAKGYTPMVNLASGYFKVTTWLNFYRQLGGDKVASDDKTALAMDRDIAIQAMEYEKQFWAYSPQNVEDAFKYFAEGQTGVLFDGSWSTGYNASVMGDTLGVTQYPQFFERPAAQSNCHGFVLPIKPERSDEKTKNALTFVKWFSDNNWKWAEAGHIPANMAVWETPEFQANTLVAPYAAGSANTYSSQSFPNFSITDAPEAIDPITRMITEDASPEETVDEIFEGINNFLATNS